MLHSNLSGLTPDQAEVSPANVADLRGFYHTPHGAGSPIRQAQHPLQFHFPMPSPPHNSRILGAQKDRRYLAGLA